MLRLFYINSSISYFLIININNYMNFILIEFKYITIYTLSSWKYHPTDFGLPLYIVETDESSGGLFFSFADDNIDCILYTTDETLNAGDHSIFYK